MLLAILLCAASAGVCVGGEDSTQPRDASNDLIRSLRRQLVQDNSDYSHDLVEQAAAVRRASPPRDALQEGIPNNYYVTNTSHQRNRYRGSGEDVDERNQPPQQPVAETDLLYYVDDGSLVTNKPEEPKYQVLKMRQPSRRSARTQYVQEEGGGAVAVLGERSAPVPQLRLPRARRQYQSASGRVAVREQALPPPPASAAGDEIPPTEQPPLATGRQAFFGDQPLSY